MALPDLTVKIGGDTSRLSGVIDEAASKLKSFASDFGDALKRDFGPQRSGIGAVTEALTGLAEVIGVAEGLFEIGEQFEAASNTIIASTGR